MSAQPHFLNLLWCCGAVGILHGAVTLWYCGTVVLWCCGVKCTVWLARTYYVGTRGHEVLRVSNVVDCDSVQNVTNGAYSE